LEVEDQRHQRLGDVAAAELAEMPALVGLVAEGVGLGGHGKPGAWQSAAGLSRITRTGDPRRTRIPVVLTGPPRSRLVSGLAGGATERGDPVHLLDARRAFKAGRRVDQRSAGEADGL